jgi:membrane protein DedA with SNARE-associated domain
MQKQMLAGRASRPVRICPVVFRSIAVAVGLLVVLAILGLLVVLAPFSSPQDQLAGLIRQHGGLAAILLLYLEESGIPAPMPGDVLVAYIGLRSPGPLAWIASWLAIIIAVTLGATNLYVIARRWGRPLVEGRLGNALGLTPEGLRRAERSFGRWGPFALILGRHIPGARIPITITAGILRVRSPLFIACVGVSTAIWAAIFMVIGDAIGKQVAAILHAHPVAYLLLPALVCLMCGYFGVRLLRYGPPRQRSMSRVSQDNRH